MMEGKFEYFDRTGKVRSTLTLVCKSSQFLQAIENASLRLNLGLPNFFYCLRLLMSLICTLYFLSISRNYLNT